MEFSTSQHMNEALGISLQNEEFKSFFSNLINSLVFHRRGILPKLDFKWDVDDKDIKPEIYLLSKKMKENVFYKVQGFQDRYNIFVKIDLSEFVDWIDYLIIDFYDDDEDNSSEGAYYSPTLVNQGNHVSVCLIDLNMNSMDLDEMFKTLVHELRHARTDVNREYLEFKTSSYLKMVNPENEEDIKDKDSSYWLKNLLYWMNPDEQRSRLEELASSKYPISLRKHDGKIYVTIKDKVVEFSKDPKVFDYFKKVILNKFDENILTETRIRFYINKFANNIKTLNVRQYEFIKRLLKKEKPTKNDLKEFLLKTSMKTWIKAGKLYNLFWQKLMQEIEEFKRSDENEREIVLMLDKSDFE